MNESHFRDKFHDNLNCLLLTEFACDNCGFNLLTDSKEGQLNCPSCGTLLEALPAIVVNRANCTHTAAQARGHEYKPDSEI